MAGGARASPDLEADVPDVRPPLLSEQEKKDVSIMATAAMMKGDLAVPTVFRSFMDSSSGMTWIFRSL
jgi:hypothetical protein